MKLAKIPEAGKPKKIASTYPADEAAELACQPAFKTDPLYAFKFDPPLALF